LRVRLNYLFRVVATDNQEDLLSEVSARYDIRKFNDEYIEDRKSEPLGEVRFVFYPSGCSLCGCLIHK